MFKKVFSIALSLVMILCMAGSTFAAEVSCDDHNHDYDIGAILAIVDVPVTADMLLKASEEGIVPCESAVKSVAYCSHPVFSQWNTIKSWYTYPSIYGNCYVLVQYQLRYCTSCATAFARETYTQLSHSWYFQGGAYWCAICGTSIVNMK